MSNIILRDYQEKAVSKAVWACQLEGGDLLVLATGAGKSIVIAEIANRLQNSVLILQPSREILEQNYTKMRNYVSDFEIGIFSASMNEKTVRKYTFATIGSIYKKPSYFAHIGLVIIDEAHQVNMKNGQSMFNSFIKGVNAIRKREGLKDLKIIGLTATPYRNMTGYHQNEKEELYSTTTLKLINRVKPEFWKRILVNVGIGDLIREGYLCPLRYEHHEFLKHEDIPLNRTHTGFELESYGVKLGSKQQQVVDSVLDAEKRFKQVLVFCPSVSSAVKFSMCVPGSEVVSAKTKPDERDRIIRGFKDKKIKTVFNMGVLTTGFDHPDLDCIVLLRPTRSLALYMQMLGRGVRIAEGKTHCTLIDWTGTVKVLGQIETVELRREQFPEYQSPMWEIFSKVDGIEKRWHNFPLYSFKVKEGGKSGYAAQKHWNYR